MNVVVTARQKKLYSDGDFTRTLGSETFDGEKSLPYLFDTILRLYRSGDGKFMAETLKDRSRKLRQGKFEVSYDLFEKCWGKRTLGRQANPLKLAAATQKEQIESLARLFGMTGEQIGERVAAYGAESLDDLTNENAQARPERRCFLPAGPLRGRARHLGEAQDAACVRFRGEAR